MKIDDRNSEVVRIAREKAQKDLEHRASLGRMKEWIVKRNERQETKVLPLVENIDHCQSQQSKLLPLLNRKRYNLGSRRNEPDQTYKEYAKT